MRKTSEEIVKLVRNAGVVGGGGAGFPTYIKLQAKVDTVIVNASECEPLLYTDKSILKEKPDHVVEGLKIALQATGAKEGVIAVKGYYTDVVESITKAIANEKNIRVHLLDNYYPAGDEFLTVYDVTKKVIPEGGIPLNVGVVVANVLTTAQIYHAVNGKPVTERVVTITGEVKEPKVVTVPVGTLYSDLIKLAGSPTLKEYTILDGGPMMGNIVTDPNDGIAKTTSGIVLLPSDHFIISMKSKTVQQMVKLSKAACCQCTRCTDLCPRNLLGHEIFPHMTMRTIDYNMSEPSQHITSTFLCSQCGMCEMVACDSMMLSPKKIYAEYRRLLVAAGVKNPHSRSDVSVNSQYENRKVSIQMMMKKIGVTQYYKPVPFDGMKEMSLVRIPIKRHIGAPAQIIVRTGQQVRRGDLIAMSPTEKLGSIYHASIHGKISDITENYVEITGQLQ